ncbi:MAG: tRNA (adenosine(37)-N6)-dimethylallyltransferase MiaA [Bacteroidota bacterium]|nr:tRNA (adenosine(37)-N6)-dimethylallyltransferase MiaA [Bacteroidota bacterium]
MKGIKKKLIVIYGPTASGKTSLAIKLAKQYNTEIISADSRQFFKEMRIGTAVPSKSELESVKHHFIQHISIHDDYNVGIFEAQASKLIYSLFEKHNTLILVGGSGLYIDALCYGLDKFPEIEPAIRQSLRNEYSLKGKIWLQNEVGKLDPIFLKNADRNNHQRLLRCLEVCIQSGQPFSNFLNKKKKDKPFDLLFKSIQLDRDTLYDRINKRVDEMMDLGLLDEVEQLIPFKHHNALQTVGYKELFAYLNNETNLNDAVDLIKRNSRRYAKRQITWLKKYPLEWV